MAYTRSFGYMLAIAAFILLCSFNFCSASRGLLELKKSWKAIGSGLPEMKQPELPMSKATLPTFPFFEEPAIWTPTPLQQIGNLAPIFPFPGLPFLPNFPPFPFIPTVPFAPGFDQNAAPASSNTP